MAKRLQQQTQLSHLPVRRLTSSCDLQLLPSQVRSTPPAFGSGVACDLRAQEDYGRRRVFQFWAQVSRRCMLLKNTAWPLRTPWVTWGRDSGPAAHQEQSHPAQPRLEQPGPAQPANSQNPKAIKCSLKL